MPNYHGWSQDGELLGVFLYIIIFLYARVDVVDEFVDFWELLIYTDDAGGKLIPEKAISLQNIWVFAAADVFIVVWWYVHFLFQNLTDKFAMLVKHIRDANQEMDKKDCGLLFPKRALFLWNLL